MKLLDRYILKETLVPFVLTLSALMMILLTGEMLRLGELFINKNVSLGTLGKLFLFILPPFLTLALPLSVLISTIIAVSRLTGDNEITALQSGGIGLLRIAAPVFLVALLAFIATFVLSVKGKPLMGTSMKKAALKLLKEEYSLGIEPGYFHEAMDGVLIYVEESPSPGSFRGLVIHDYRNPEKPYFIIAKTGEVLNDPDAGFLGFRLKNGSQHIAFSNSDRYQWIKFSQYEFKVGVSPRVESISGAKEAAPIEELKLKLTRGEPTSPRERDTLMDYYQTYSFPFSCLLFGFIGIPLGLMIKQSGRMGGFAAGLGVALFYYIFAILGRFFASSGWVEPLWAAWFPNLVGLGLIIAIYILSKRGSFFRNTVFSGR